MNKEVLEKLSGISMDFQGLSEKARRLATEEYKEKEPDGLFAIRVALDGQIARQTLRFIEKIENTNEKISYQLDLSNSFIRTHFVINNLILTGDIIEALILIRKQVENLARLIEIDDKPLAKIKGKTPNVCNIIKKAGKKLYPELSEVAHFGTPRVGNLLKTKNIEEGKSGPSVFPVFSKTLFEVYKQHSFISIYFLFWINGFIKSIYKEKYDSTSDDTILDNIYKKAVLENIMRLDLEEK
ncbi:MAG: hypothetical protein ACPGTG_03890 [Flavobacteriales bacterium]